MKKVFIIMGLAAAVSFASGCGANTVENANLIEANTAANTQTETADLRPEETPLPEFTNADEALAAGKNLLDDLETEKAIEALRQAVKLNPDLAEAHFNLGIAYSLVEKAEDESVEPSATPSPTPARKAKKNAPPVRTRNSEKAFENAVKAYKKIIAKNSKDDAAHYNLGRSYNKLNEDEDAMKALREAVKLKPEEAEYQAEYGAILIKLAQYDEAVTALKKARSLDESNLLVEEMLERAEAGKKRVNFGVKPKPPTQQVEETRPRETRKAPVSKKPPEQPAPAKTNTDQ